MQPNDPQGYNSPQAAQPAQPVVPPQPQPQPVAPVQPVAQPQPVMPVQPIAPTPGLAPAVDPAALQAALSEPALAPAQPIGPIGSDNATGVDEQLSDEEQISWVAHEYIHREKGALWFFLFVVVIVALLAVSIFLMQSWSFAVLLAVIAVVVVVYSRRPPRELSYALTDEGLSIDGSLHKFSDFKSFGVLRDGEEYSVMLTPIRRFQPGVTVYFPEEAGEAIVDVLGSRLPMKDVRLDAVDRVVRLLRL